MGAIEQVKPAPGLPWGPRVSGVNLTRPLKRRSSRFASAGGSDGDRNLHVASTRIRTSSLAKAKSPALCGGLPGVIPKELHGAEDLLLIGRE